MAEPTVLYCDASLRFGIAGWAVVDIHGVTLASGRQRAQSINEVENRAVNEAVRLAREIKGPVEIRTDNYGASLKCGTRDVRVVHISRDLNRAADRAAREALKAAA